MFSTTKICIRLQMSAAANLGHPSIECALYRRERRLANNEIDSNQCLHSWFMALDTISHRLSVLLNTQATLFAGIGAETEGQICEHWKLAQWRARSAAVYDCI